jgi:TatA/E family protein of Tat protein translocase
MSFSPSVALLTGSVGPGEWVVLFVVVLIVVGPKRLPEIARKLGRTMEMFRRAADEFKDQLLTMDQEQAAAKPPAPSGESGSAGQEDSSSDAYPNMGDYPGNEDHVENWSSESQLEPEGGSAGEPPAPQGPEGAGDAAASNEPLEKPTEGGA